MESVCIYRSVDREAVKSLNKREKNTQTSLRMSVFSTTILIAVLVTGLVVFSLYWNISSLREEIIILAKVEAESHWNKDAAFRRWASRHGGVYVKPDERTPKNPYLAHVPDRDLMTADGKELTLMNPAYMMSQLTREFEEMYGVKGRITGKMQLNPANKPDVWEFAALTQFENGAKKVVATTQIEGQPYLRFMKPVYMSESCIKCHGSLGYQVGDIRGGISVSVPLDRYNDAALETKQSMWATHVMVWFIAMIAILFYYRILSARQVERQQMLQQLEHDALHDGLTTLPNRFLFLDRLNHAITRAQRETDYQFAVCFLDMDRFKNLNDSYGHLIGDAILIQIAERFNRVIRPSDTVARIGGDEFTLLLEDVSGLNEALVIAERILLSLKAPFQTEVGELYLNASLGLCMSAEIYQQAEDMLRDADIAMYRAKESGRGRIDVFNQEMHDQAIEVMQMENDLRHAVEKKELEIFFQPVVDIHRDKIAGFEALLRWQHPRLGFISPEVFIPLAEDTSLINDIGTWVMLRACQVVREWNLEFGQGESLGLSVNISGKQLIHPDLVPMIQSILASTRFDPRLLHCEVTESVMIQHKERATEVIKQLKADGIKVSVDDFGKGYSSLTYLQEFDFDILKIDKDFVQDMGEHGKGLQLVKTMLLLARDFDMTVVAEGVEQNDQLNRLQAMGCQLIQGHYYAKPMREPEIHELLKRGALKKASLLISSRQDDPDDGVQVIPTVS